MHFLNIDNKKFKTRDFTFMNHDVHIDKMEILTINNKLFEIKKNKCVYVICEFDATNKRDRNLPKFSIA